MDVTQNNEEKEQLLLSEEDPWKFISDPRQLDSP